MSKILAHSEDMSVVVTDFGLFDAREAMAAKPRTPVDPEYLTTHFPDMAPWGDSNDFPDEIELAIGKNSDLAAALDWQARALYSGGVRYRLRNMKTGEEMTERRPEIDAFIKRNFQYPIGAAKDWYKFNNIWPELGLTNDGGQVYWLHWRPAVHCRFGKQNKAGEIEWVYVHADWSNAGSISQVDVLKRRAVNPYVTEAADLKELVAQGKVLQWMYPLGYPTGKSYYQKTAWNGLRHNKWLDLADEIPKFKLAVMQNQLSIKYLIKIPDYYWEWKFDGKWAKMSPTQRAEAKVEEIKAMSTFLKGSEKAGLAMTTPYKFDAHRNVQYPGIEIEPIGDKMKDGIYLEDSVEATIKIYSALGLDPALAGIIPGKSGTNRSGSDKREALDIYLSLIQAHEVIVLRPYDFAADYNGWNTDEVGVEFFFNHPYLQTLDEVTPAQRRTVLPEMGEEGN